MTSSLAAGFRALPLPIVQLSLAAVLKCGQSFRWLIFPLSSFNETVEDPCSPTHEYRFCLPDRLVCLRQSSDTLFYRSVFPETPSSPTQEALKDAETLAWLRDYFQLDIDLVKLYDEWSLRDPVFRKLRDRFSGIRMLRQDPWENLISFICSSNNNISRITKMVNSLCKHYSLPLTNLPAPGGSESETYYPFPPPSVLAAPEVGSTLRSLGFGYRGPFIQRTAEMLVNAHAHGRTQDGREASEHWLITLRDMDTCAAREELLKFIGVGRKVADCILLMSLDKREVIPVDTHVHQIAIKHYGLRGASGSKANMTPKLYDEVNAKLAKVWGDYAGWAHSVLFTADLKSFSSYGFPSPSPSTIMADTPAPHEKISIPILPTPLLKLSPSLAKRKRGRYSIIQKAEIQFSDELAAVSATEAELCNAFDGPTSIADRIKKRRRVTAMIDAGRCELSEEVVSRDR